MSARAGRPSLPDDHTDTIVHVADADDPVVCFRPGSAVTVGLRIGHAIAHAATRESALKAIASIVHSEVDAPVAVWFRATGGPWIFLTEHGLPRQRRQRLLDAASSWSSSDRSRSLEELGRIFSAVAGTHDTSVVDLLEGLIVVGDRCDDLEESRHEIARAIASLPVGGAPSSVFEDGRQDLRPRRLIEGLTPREREVLALIAEGLGTHQISDRLYISSKTVKTHVQNILPKLGVTSRVEAVAVLRRALDASGSR